jgi:hypothetical protein
VLYALRVDGKVLKVFNGGTEIQWLMVPSEGGGASSGEDRELVDATFRAILNDEAPSKQEKIDELQAKIAKQRQDVRQEKIDELQAKIAKQRQDVREEQRHLEATAHTRTPTTARNGSFNKRDRVKYRSPSGAWLNATVVEKSYDDPPYYTIWLDNGQERQTEGARLRHMTGLAREDDGCERDCTERDDQCSVGTAEGYLQRNPSSDWA